MTSWISVFPLGAPCYSEEEYQRRVHVLKRIECSICAQLYQKGDSVLVCHNSYYTYHKECFHRSGKARCGGCKTSTILK